MDTESIKRQKSYPACGRLIVLQALGSGGIESQLNASENFTGFTAINFPSMPDSIELARRAEYVVSTPWGMPDGIHFYKGTSVLKIPFSFKLHSFDDEYCPQGAKTVLEVAAALHSLVLPFGRFALPVAWSAPQQRGEKPAQDHRSIAVNAQEAVQLSYTPPSDIFPPATCFLELILTDRRSVGLACVGYVEDVKVRLMGPFLRGPGIAQNLPTAGEFDFTFVHHPGHGNAFQLPSPDTEIFEKQAYAEDIKDKFYNTVGLLTDPNNFVSFNTPSGK